MAELAAGDRVIDIGCGTGRLTMEIADRVGPQGFVLGIDPDVERIEVARSKVPTAITYVDFVNMAVGDLKPDRVSFDWAYSNYVMHWVKDKSEALQAIANCLRVGGQFAMGCSLTQPGEHMTALVDIARKSGPNLLDKVFTVDAKQWQQLFEHAGFVVDKIDVFVEMFDFANFDGYFEWAKATSHGMINAENISSEDLAHLRQRFPGAIHAPREVIRILAKK